MKESFMSQTKTHFHLIKDNISLTTQAFIDGNYCDAADGDRLETSNPATGETITSFAHLKPPMSTALSPLVAAFSMKAHGHVQHQNIVRKCC